MNDIARLSLRISPSLNQAMKQVAKKDNLSVNSLIIQTLLERFEPRSTRTSEGTLYLTTDNIQVCRYCAAFYDAEYGGHVCNTGDLLTLIDQEKDKENDADVAAIRRLEGRIVQVADFWRKYPNHKTSTSHRMPD